MKSLNPIVFVLGAIFMVGCAASPKIRTVVAPGDRVAVDYVCRFENGELAATTLAAAANSSKETQSYVFRPPATFAPFVCKIGDEGFQKRSSMGRSKIIGFETAVRRELQKQLAGLPAGKTIAIELIAHENATLSRDVRYYTASRTRVRKKERRKSLAKYIDYTGRTPAVGQQHDVDHVFTATVTQVDPATDTIVTRIEPRPDAVYPSDFGSARIVDGGDVYRIVFDVAEGQLVRSGNWVGRIDQVEKNVFTVDWGHPFGHEILSCEVTVNPTK